MSEDGWEYDDQYEQGDNDDIGDGDESCGLCGDFLDIPGGSEHVWSWTGKPICAECMESAEYADELSDW